MKILATSYQGIGNNILFTPAIQIMRKIFPYVQIDVVSRFPDLYSGMQFVNPIRSEAELKKFYDIGFTALFGPSEIYKGIGLGQAVPPPQLSYNTEHEIALNIIPIVEELDYEGEIPPQYVPIVDMFNFTDKDKLSVGICDGSKPRSDCQTDMEYQIWNKKRWPYYTELIEELVAKGCEVFIFGTEEDGPKMIPENDLVKDLRGKFALLQLPSALQKLDMFVTNDTGPMHVADAAGVNQVAIFGPTSIVKNAPVGDNSLIVDATEITGIEEPEQGTKEFAEAIISPSLEALEPEIILGAIKEFKKGNLTWL